MKKFITFIIILFSVMTASADTAWVSTYYETDEGYEEPFDDVIVFHDDGTYTLYSVEYNFVPIVGEYYTFDNNISLYENKDISRLGTFTISDNSLTLDYVYDDIHVIDHFVQIQLSDIEDVVKERKEIFKQDIVNN